MIIGRTFGKKADGRVPYLRKGDVNRTNLTRKVPNK